MLSHLFTAITEDQTNAKNKKEKDAAIEVRSRYASGGRNGAGTLNRQVNKGVDKSSVKNEGSKDEIENGANQHDGYDDLHDLLHVGAYEDPFDDAYQPEYDYPLQGDDDLHDLLYDDAFEDPFDDGYQPGYDEPFPGDDELPEYFYD